MPSAPWVQERVWRAQQTVVTTTLGQLQVWAALTQQAHEGKHSFIPKLSSVLEAQTPKEAKE